MGNKDSSNFEGIIKIQDWQLYSQGNKFNILRNIFTMELIQVHVLIFQNEKQLLREINFFKKRLYISTNVVQLKGWQVFKSNQMCSNFFNLKVYIQRIPKRLRNINNMPLGKSLWILHQSLIGFNTIIKEFTDYYEINDNMICFDNENNVKVWCNQNLIQVNCYGENLSKQMSSIEIKHKMILKLLQTIEKHKEFKKFPQNFYDFINKQVNYPYSFEKMISACQLYYQQYNVDEAFPSQSKEYNFSSYKKHSNHQPTQIQKNPISQINYKKNQNKNPISISNLKKQKKPLDFVCFENKSNVLIKQQYNPQQKQLLNQPLNQYTPNPQIIVSPRNNSREYFQSIYTDKPQNYIPTKGHQLYQEQNKNVNYIIHNTGKVKVKQIGSNIYQINEYVKVPKQFQQHYKQYFSKKSNAQ